MFFASSLITRLMKVGAIKRKSLISFFLSVFTTFLGIITTMYFAHKLGPDILGIYFLFISYFSIFLLVGEKITWRDGVRALYCVFRYNSDHLPLPIQFAIYALIGGAAALVNLACFLALFAVGLPLTTSAAVAFAAAAAVNYGLCVAVLFRHRARWGSTAELLTYLAVVAAVGTLDVGITQVLYASGMAAWLAKSCASLVGLTFNFLGRRYVVF